jgi:hypothetical protein
MAGAPTPGGGNDGDSWLPAQHHNCPSGGPPPVAGLPREQYEQGKRDGLNQSVPTSPWSLPASEWTPLQRRAYIIGWRNGRSEAAKRPKPNN